MNFTWTDKDSTSTRTSHFNIQARRHTSSLLSSLDLVELYQPSHTHVCPSSSPSGVPRTSRIDHFYIAIPPALNALTNIHAHVTDIPISPLDREAKRLHPPDHLPLAVRVNVKALSRRGSRPPPLPTAYAKDPQVIKEITRRWQNYPSHYVQLSPPQKLKRFKKIIRKVVKNHMKTAPKSSPILALTAAIQSLRILHLPSPNFDYIHSLLSPHPSLQESLADLQAPSPNSSKLQSYINAILTTNRHPEPSRSPSPSQLKTYLPADRTYLSCLKHPITNELITEPNALANNIIPTWSSIWSPKCCSSQDYEALMKLYNKKLPPGNIPPPTLEAVEEAIKSTNDSAPGPDGIPFIFYRRLSTIIAPILHKLILLISTTQKAPKAFNHSLLYMLPKVHLPTPDQCNSVL